MKNKTPEERRAIVAKGVATRRANSNARKSARQAALRYADGLQAKIDALELRLSSLERMETMHAVSSALTGKALLRPEEIAQAALPWATAPGVYFLLDGNEIVYVGQARHVYSRIAQHTSKRFNQYAFVPCAVNLLDRLESLYIHMLRPRLNGDQVNGTKCAPIALDTLLAMTPNA